MSEISSIRNNIGIARSAVQSGEVKFVEQDKNKSANSPSFGETIGDFLQSVNDKQKNAGSKVADVIQGRSEDIADAMIAVEQSRVSFQLMMEIRNKMLDAYQEIQRMQM